MPNPNEREVVMSWRGQSPTAVGSSQRYGDSVLPASVTSQRVLQAYGVSPQSPVVNSVPTSDTNTYATPADTTGQRFMAGDTNNQQLALRFNPMSRDRNPYAYGMSAAGEHQFFVPTQPAVDPATVNASQRVGETGMTSDQILEQLYNERSRSNRQDIFSGLPAASGGMISHSGIGHRGYNGNMRGPGSHGGVPQFAGGGLIDSATPGRADQINTAVPAGTYIVPADVVSTLGQGNTAAGGKVIDQMLAHLNSARSTPQDGYARGGHVPVKLSGGEYAIPPEQVKAAGGPNALDNLVMMVRREMAQRAQTLPPPR